MRSIASRNLPPILAFNTNVQSEELMDIWMDNRKQTFLKPRVKLHGQVNGVDDPESVEYELKVGFLLRWDEELPRANVRL